MLSYRGGCRWSLAASLALTLAGGFAAWLVPSAAQPPQTKEAGPARSTRAAWTTSRVIGSPDPPPPFKVVRAFPNLKFNNPLLMARYPGGERLIVGEHSGVLYSFKDTPDAKADLFCDLRKEIKTIHLLPDAKEIMAVYGLAFHPDFAKNRQCFVCYTLKSKNTSKPNFTDGSRVSRFTVTRTDPPRLDPASEQIVLTFLQGGHNGGDIHFGPDGMLYISTGDAASPNPPDAHNTGQDISDLLSSILRIDVNRKEKGINYAVPKDNPFIGMKDARPEVWAYGFRNPWRMSFDTKTGELFVGDVGWELWESIHRVEKGGNYGWSAMEGPQPIKPQKIGPTPIRPALIELPHTISCSVTGGRVYYGKKFPELRGAYIFGDWETRRLWAARFDGDRAKEMPEIARPSVRIVAFGEDKDGEIYFLDYEGGTVHTIARNEAVAKNANFPTKLSETGLFSSVKDHAPAAGVVPFAINGRQWQDGATAEHWAAFPGTSAATYYPTGKAMPGMVYWHTFRMHFPKDAVLTRTLSLGGRRIETQIMHYDGVDWRPYTFAWRDDQTDADLVPADGAEKEIVDSKPRGESSNPAGNLNPAGNPRDSLRSSRGLDSGAAKRVWQFQSRSQCMTCHNNQSEYGLAFLPEQLNRPGRDGRNQLVSLTEAGYIRRAGKDEKPLPPFDAVSAAREPKIADPADASQPLEARARAYLHANCGHCHFEHGGGSVPLRLQFSVSVAEMKAVGVRPMRGDFGLPNAYIIKPGDPWASTLYYRMAKFGRDRMPHIGAERPDEAGLKLVEDWIIAMASGERKRPESVGPPDKLLADPQSAMVVARKVGLGELKLAERAPLLAAAANLPAGPIRDLFEGYLPQGDKATRKLGSNPRPRSILALKGNPGQGEKLFWSKSLNCGSCHKIGSQGTAVGPDLSTIGKLRVRDDLLESILEPSRRIEPKYAAYVAQTADGRSLTGLLVKRDEKEVVLRDSQNKEIILAAKNVEMLQPARMSLMPDGQMAGLTAQEAADLLEYLATRK
jgi:putative heme-binding domain-containing protein